LGLRDRELSETPDALDAMTEVLRKREEQLAGSRKETERLQRLLSQASARATASKNSPKGPDLAAQVLTLQNQTTEQLVSYLKQAEDEERKALNLILPTGSGNKRKRIKEEESECTRVAKRLRKEPLGSQSI
jgi:hypothetical protein